jgi:hypothetical protein
MWAPDAVPREIYERRRRHTLELLLVCAIGLVPWTVLLALTLPREYQVHEWPATWVGFDVLLVAAMASTAYFGWRRHPAVILSGLATAVLLVCDAWFDVSLAFGTSDVWLSGGLAVFVELPLAGFILHRVYSLISVILAISGDRLPIHAGEHPVETVATRTPVDSR